MFDAAVIGGGLAGCSAAITLAKQGTSVILFESKTYPHHKVCGEFLSPECVYLLEELGVLTDVYALHPKPIDTVAISSPDGTLWEAKLPNVALGVSRFLLDDCLAKQAVKQGVIVRQGTSVMDVEGSLDETFKLNLRSNSGVEQVSVKVVIGAQGKRSTLDRTLNRAFLRQPQPFIALKSHFYGPSLPNRVELHTFMGGYCGMSEVEGRKSNVCLLVREDVFRKVCDNAQSPIAAFIRWMQNQNPKLDKWLSHAEQIGEQWLSISQVPFVQKQVIENDILMMGDSAGLIVPLAGDGMAMALHAGILGAKHAAAFLGGRISADELRRGYETAWTNEFGARLKFGKALQSVMLHPRLLEAGLRLLNTIPPLGTFIIKHTRDTKSLTRSLS
jgi:menaquinone-9 beta-reductase